MCTKKYTLNLLLNQQESMSKVKNLIYKSLQLQSYLKNKDVSVEMARNVFLFRNRMLCFGENFHGKDKKPCPFDCFDSWDSQSHFFKCLEIRKYVMNVNITEENFFHGDIQTRDIRKLNHMLKIREDLLEKKYQNFKPF